MGAACPPPQESCDGCLCNRVPALQQMCTEGHRHGGAAAAGPVWGLWAARHTHLCSASLAGRSS
jgi:hypothetical protein